MEESLNVITDARFVGESSLVGPRPLTILFEDDLVPSIDLKMHLIKLTIEVPSSFPYTNNKMVPWNYNYNYVNEPTVTNILGIGGMTQSGRFFVLVSTELAPSNLVKGLTKQKELEMILDMINELVIENDAFEFLKFIKHGEYSAVEQLNKLLARISLLPF